MDRPYTLPEPVARPSSFSLTRTSAHRTDAHRQHVHGRLEPMREPLRPWWQLW